MIRPPLIFQVSNAVRLGFKHHGIWFPFIMLHRAWLCAYRKYGVRGSFTVAGEEHRYFIHPLVLDNERTVEVALARDFLHGETGDILEIGNVLSNYLAIPHDVVDKYEKTPGVINEDIISYAPQKKYDVIVTLSTLEHVGWDEEPREPEKIVLAINRLKELLKEGGELFATLPIGYNSFVDRMILDKSTGFPDTRYLLRVSPDNRWREARFEEVAGAKFGSPFACANAIAIGRFRKQGGVT